MDSKEYWKNIHERKFISKNNSNNLPWDIEQPDPNLKWIIDFINLSNKNILEVGCGSGNDAIYLSNNGFEVDAIDLHPISIDKAKSKSTQVNFICGDVFYDLPSNKTYDLIYDRGFIHNLNFSSFPTIFDFFYSKLNSQGLIVVMTGHPHFRKLKTTLPTPVPYYEMILGFRDMFNIKLIKEVPFLQNEDYEDGVGMVYILEKIG